DVRGGTVQLHAHYRDAAGQLCREKQYAGAGSGLTGTANWTFISGTFTMPRDIASFQLHLTMNATGTVWHDDVALVEVAPATVGSVERRSTDADDLAVWPVNAIVKVFQEDAASAKPAPARIAAARGEAEPLQLAIRSGRAVKQVTVEIDPPASANGRKLTDVTVGLVGFVPIDHKTSYYRSTSPAWHRKFPTGSGRCDGWAGMWPDPILPRKTFDLAIGKTQPVWITVTVPKDAPAGDYEGAVRLTHNGKLLKKAPFTVHVWDFALPDQTHLAAVYDVRTRSPLWRRSGETQDAARRRMWRFMAERRLCPDRVSPEPVLRYKDGKVHADFTKYDEAAAHYFDALKLPHTYTPRCFYLFGWGHPPGVKFGQRPYEGDPPYDGADRSKLRPAFKRAYQACLKAYWEHMKARGWHRKVLLYISDEPHDRHEHIREQMKALCDMIHEVDPQIPIYSSTWHHQPAWDASLDVWGIGHYGVVPTTKMAELRAAGKRLWFTTDGHMCTDTPYCAVERLLPHYCFQYGAEAYEFWGVDWLTYNPYEFGWHRYIHQSDTPGQSYYVRYPNGDGYLAYPGAPVGSDGPVPSIRLEQAREGVEDYEYLYLLRGLVAKAKAGGRDASAGEAALRAAATLVTIPNAGGRYSTGILADPDAVFRVREQVARAIEKLRR
ncbi:MAG: glycoside hydrolase domain-containing protein, partial [Phycisphaerae bacterium]